MKMMLTSLLVFVSATLCLAGTSDWHWGRCPEVEAIKDFNVTGLDGKWYVIEKSGAIFHYDFPSCQVLTYKKESEDMVSLTDSLEYGKLLQVLFHRQEDTTNLTIPDANKANCMRQTYLNIYKSSYCVVDTDYQTYAAIYECQNYSYMHKQAVTILSREKELDSNITTTLKARLHPFHVRDQSYMIVDHSDCRHHQQDENSPHF